MGVALTPHWIAELDVELDFNYVWPQMWIMPSIAFLHSHGYGLDP